MSYQDFIMDFEKFRKTRKFLQNAKDEFITLTGKVNTENPTEATWGEMIPNSYKRINLMDGKKYIWYYKSVDTDERKKVTFGILIPWNLLTVIKSMSFDEEKKELSIEIKKASNIIFYDSTKSTSYISSLQKFKDLDTPIIGSDTTTMDSKSPAHDKNGLSDMSDAFKP